MKTWIFKTKKEIVCLMARSSGSCLWPHHLRRQRQNSLKCWGYPGLHSWDLAFEASDSCFNTQIWIRRELKRWISSQLGITKFSSKSIPLKRTQNSPDCTKLPCLLEATVLSLCHQRHLRKPLPFLFTLENLTNLIQKTESKDYFHFSANDLIMWAHSSNLETVSWFCYFI